jgi:signal transduction histidine kinase
VQLEKEGAPAVPEGKAIHVYRVLQEALTNVAKHSKATKATVRLRYRTGTFGLEIEDDGVGISSKVPAGLGLIAMRERAELVHGQFEVSTASSGGTLVRLRIPLEEADQ